MQRHRIQKVLVANRGEIALRIIRTCEEMGIRTVAVYSEADRTALHVRRANEAYEIGPPPPLESYLAMDKIIQVAKAAKCDAVHPGYGFLSESPDFAWRVERSGLVFVGPTARSIRALGDKLRARDLVSRAGVPVVPGSPEPIRDLTHARQIASELGYPVLLKAVGGGGGRGMRIVKEEKELGQALREAVAETRSAFGDPRVYIEKYLRHPRHIEVQILGDNYDNVIHLGERECSIQRRFQKMIEESPSTFIDDALRAEISSAAVRAAKASRYRSAGTVEFLVDEDKKFYFLEVNTRIQVEHPVTEMRTGLDIVEEQLRIASGESIRWKQEEISPRGHSIECRIYAEDADQGFLPSVGKIAYLRPAQGNGIRIDSALEVGTEITSYYDALISKVVSWGIDRAQAISRMDRALREYLIAGIKTTIPFCLYVINHKGFRNGKYDTGFVQEFSQRDHQAGAEGDGRLIAAISGVLLAGEGKASPILTGGGPIKDGWSGWKAKRIEQEYH